jgi:hypothetical protein
MTYANECRLGPGDKSLPAGASQAPSGPIRRGWSRHRLRSCLNTGSGIGTALQGAFLRTEAGVMSRHPSLAFPSRSRIDRFAGHEQGLPQSAAASRVLRQEKSAGSRCRLTINVRQGFLKRLQTETPDMRKSREEPGNGHCQARVVKVNP